MELQELQIDPLLSELGSESILTQNNLQERPLAGIRLDQGYHQPATSQRACLPVEQGTGMLDRAGRTWPCLGSTYLSVFIGPFQTSCYRRAQLY